MISKFICFRELSPSDLVSLNMMRMHKKVIHKSDIILCDGKTIKTEMLTGSPSHSVSHKFPTQCPTPADLAIWNTALGRLSSAFLVLTVKLQECIGPSHATPLWLLDNLGTALHHNMVLNNKLYHEVYLPSSDTFACSTRLGQRYNSKLIAYGHSVFQRCANVTLLREGQVFPHSTLP